MWGEIFNMDNPLVGADNTWVLWAICAAGAAGAIYLEQKYTWAAKASGAIVALVMALILSNLGIIPTASPVWDTVWNYVVPLSLPLLLMQCNVRDMGKDSLRLLGIFLCGSVGTMAGALIGFAVLGNFIPELNALAGVFTGTYIGGSVNFAALGEAFGVTGEMLSAATVADNLLMALYFFVLVMIPGIGFFRKHYKHPHQDAVESGTADSDAEGTAAAAYWGRKEMSLKDIALAVAVAFVIVAVSGIVADFLAGVIPTSNPVLSMLNTLFGNMYLWIATISMICATAAPGFFGEIRGTNEMGTFLIYLFFFVIGVPASIPLIVRNSPLLLVFAAIVVIVNMLFSLVLGKIFKFDLEEILCASNANIGGPTTSAAMAVSKGWTKGRSLPDRRNHRLCNRYILRPDHRKSVRRSIITHTIQGRSSAPVSLYWRRAKVRACPRPWRPLTIPECAFWHFR